jgi:hypothetical protein
LSWPPTSWATGQIENLDEDDPEIVYVKRRDKQ